MRMRHGIAPWHGRIGPGSGFTLIEVMIALAILAMTIPILLGLRNRDVDLAGYARQMTKATFLAQEKLFETEQLGFLPIGEQAGDFTLPPPGFPVGFQATDRASGFRWTRTVLTTPFTSIREIRIRVSWSRGAGEEAVELSTYAFSETKA